MHGMVVVSLLLKRLHYQKSNLDILLVVCYNLQNFERLTMQLYNYSKSLQLSDYYKKYGHSFLDTNEFIQRWGGSVPFKLMDNRICADSLLTRKVITKQLNQMFTIDSVPDTIHCKILTIYFDSLIEMGIIPENTQFQSNLKFDSDKVQIFKKGSLYFKRPSTLSYPINKQNNAYDEQFFNKSIVDRVIFNQSIFVNEHQYNYYTVMSNYGVGSIDNEFMKFSYYISDGSFCFIAPKCYSQQEIFQIPVDRIDEIYSNIKQLIKRKLFVSFYEKNVRILFRKVLTFDEFNDVHLKILNMFEDIPIKRFMQFMEENNLIDDVLSLDDYQTLQLYTVSLTTFEMINI